MCGYVEHANNIDLYVATTDVRLSYDYNVDDVPALSPLKAKLEHGMNIMKSDQTVPFACFIPDSFSTILFTYQSGTSNRKNSDTGNQ